ncbi:MAG: fructose reductase [Betaproteobacteria bacterium]|nr:fructose reductase [Betaproteobacteria bacterium]
MPQAENPVQWGVIGLGGVVEQQIAPAIVGSAHSTLVACTGSTPEKSRAFAQKYSVEHCYNSIEELASAKEVEAIFIATPNADHHRMVLAAARARKHVLCEKPLALSADHGREMIEVCREAGVIFRVAFQIRLEEILIRAREVVRSGMLGELRSVLFERIAPLRQHGAWRDDPRQGGVLFDVAVHLFDQVKWLTGMDIGEVSAYSHPDRRLGAADSTIAILGTLGDGCHVVVRASREIAHAGNDLRIQGSKGMLTTSALRWADEHVLQIKTDAGLVEERFAATAIYKRQMEAFALEVRGGAGVLASGEDGLRAIRIASAVLESIETRRSVAVPLA